MLAVRIRVRFRRWIRNRGNGSCQQAQQYYTAAFHFVSLSLGTEAITHSVFRSSGCIPTGAIWQAANINPSTGSSPGLKLQILVDDTIYFDADTGAGTGRELWAHNISNLSTWRVTDIASGSADSWPGTYMEILVGDTLYFSSYEVSSGYEMWAHNTSNLSTWRVKDISSSGSSNPGQYMSILLGDTIYFSANDGTTGIELWAHDTSNGSTWRVADIYTGSFGSAPGYWSGTIQVENTIYFLSLIHI